MIINQINSSGRKGAGGVKSVIEALNSGFKKDKSFIILMNQSIYHQLNEKKASSKIINHLHGIWTVKLFWLATTKIFFKIPFVVTVHGMLNPWALNHKRLKKKLFLPLVKYCLNQANGIICNTDVERSIVESHCKVKIKTVPNFVSLYSDEIENIQASKIENKFISVGRYHPTKNLKNLIMALQEFNYARTGADKYILELYGFGEAAYTAELKEMLSKLKIENHVRICGPLYGREKYQALKSARAVFIPSLNEGFPMVCLEAGINKSLICMSSACNLDVYFEKNAAINCGLTIASIGSCMNKVDKLSEEKNVEMRAAAGKLTCEKYSAEVVLEQYKSYYTTIIQS